MSPIEDLRDAAVKYGIPILAQTDVKEDEGDGLARGGYGIIRLGTRKADKSRVVIKRMLDYLNDEDHCRLFCKEIRILAKTTVEKHPNIVRLLGVCLEPVSAILEYIEFNLDDINFHKASQKGNNTLAHLLRILDELKLVEEVGVKQGVLRQAAFDIANGLAFLHKNDICHRDLKPSNVLATNLDLSFRFKITDFGESRGRDLQTASLHTSTDRVQRGTEFYFAPEVYMHTLKEAGIQNFKPVDIWAYGMIIFCLLSPDLKYPWEKELKTPAILKAMTEHILPRGSDKYKHLLKQTGLHQIYTNCCQYDVTSRPTMNDIVDKLTSMTDSHKNTGSSASPAAAAEHVDSGAQAGVVPENPTQHPQKSFAAEQADLQGWVSEHNTTWLDLDATTCEGMVAIDEGDIDDPTGICVLDHHIVVSDRKKNQVLLFQKAGPGNYSDISSLGGEGQDCFNEPCGICAGHNGRTLVYVSDYGSRSVKEIDIAEDGQLRVRRALTAGGRLDRPRDVCTAYNDGQLLVACHDGVHRIDVTTGDLISTLPTPTGWTGCPSGVAYRDRRIVVTHDNYTRFLVYTAPYTQGARHTIEGLQSPKGIFIDNERNIFVADSDGNRILRLDLYSGFASVYQVGSPYCKPWHMALDGEHLLITSWATVLRADMAQFRPTP